MATLEFIKTSAPFIENRETILLERACISTPNTRNTSHPCLLDIALLLKG